MYEKIDSQEQIVLAQISKLLTKYSYRILDENGEGENLLRCTGLSNLVDNYSNMLNPYAFYRGYKNENKFFNPGLAIMNICLEIESNKELLGVFLKEFLQRIREVDVDDISDFKNYFDILGYKFVVEEVETEYSTEFKYKLQPSVNGSMKRQEDISYLVTRLNKKRHDLTHYYEEAISTFGNSEFKSCIVNCRSLLEKFFQVFDSTNNSYSKGILAVTGESINYQGTELTSINKIFKYWIEHKEKANRYRLFVTLYSAMSGLGPHGEEVPTREDALLFLRMTEDTLLWYFRKFE